MGLRWGVRTLGSLYTGLGRGTGRCSLDRWAALTGGDEWCSDGQRQTDIAAGCRRRNGKRRGDDAEGNKMKALLIARNVRSQRMTNDEAARRQDHTRSMPAHRRLLSTTNRCASRNLTRTWFGCSAPCVLPVAAAASWWDSPNTH